MKHKKLPIEKNKKTNNGNKKKFSIIIDHLFKYLRYQANVIFKDFLMLYLGFHLKNLFNFL